jgi:hypothetical protein
VCGQLDVGTQETRRPRSSTGKSTPCEDGRSPGASPCRSMDSAFFPSSAWPPPFISSASSTHLQASQAVGIPPESEQELKTSTWSVVWSRGCDLESWRAGEGEGETCRVERSSISGGKNRTGIWWHFEYFMIRWEDKSVQKKIDGLYISTI